MKLVLYLPTTLLLCAFVALPVAHTAETRTRADPSDLAGGVTRARLADQVDRNVDALERAMAVARQAALALDPQGRMAFNKVSREVSNAAHELHTSLLAAQHASDAEWDQARSVLASDYERFAQAVAQAQRIATLGNSANAQALSFENR